MAIQNWDITASKSGNYTFKTQNTYADRDININIPPCDIVDTYNEGELALQINTAGWINSDAIIVDVENETLIISIT